LPHPLIDVADPGAALDLDDEWRQINIVAAVARLAEFAPDADAEFLAQQGANLALSISATPLVVLPAP
jgi:hypothetical protein